jgi:hypothetical protein
MDEEEEGRVAVGIGCQGEINLRFTRTLTEAKDPRVVSVDNLEEIFRRTDVKRG